MKLLILVIILEVGHLTRAQADLLEDVSASTLKGVSFNMYALSMEMDSDGKYLIVTDSHSIWRFEPITKEKTHIAGSKYHGYTEGVGEAAKFYSPDGLMVTKNKAIIGDTSNQCLREVDLITRQTFHLAGTCQSSGFRDGQASTAQFNSPLGLLNHKSGILVADHWNHAVRLVAGGNVSTIVSGSSVRKVACLTEMDGQVFATTDSGLLNLDVDSGSAQLVAGTGFATGFSDGVMSSARFDTARSLVSAAPGLLLIVDSRNYRIRLVDLAREKVSSICSGFLGSADGSGDRCQLQFPWSVQVVGDKVYIGEYGGKIRTIPVKSFIGK